MCHKLIDYYTSCGHTETGGIPCDEFCRTETCPKPEEDIKNTHDDRKCSECQHLERQLKLINEDEELAAPVSRSMRDPNTPVLYYILRTKWSLCDREFTLPCCTLKLNGH